MIQVPAQTLVSDVIATREILSSGHSVQMPGINTGSISAHVIEVESINFHFWTMFDERSSMSQSGPVLFSAQLSVTV